MSEEGGPSNAAQTTRTLREFLESASPGIVETVTDATQRNKKNAPPAPFISNGPLQKVSSVLAWPQITLFCPDAECDRPQNFVAYTTGPEVSAIQHVFVTYTCRNCMRTKKTFALRFTTDDISTLGPIDVLKLGEFPSLDEKVPSKLLALVGKDRELFFQGRRAEKAGLGIGAYSYYRRVVENQKDQIFDKVAEAAKLLGHADLAAEIEAAKMERKFAAAVERIKHALPDSLRVGGNDPLRVLHSALSEGLHNRDDQHCLEFAETIREVLGGLAERIARAKQDEQKLAQSIGKLMREAEKGDGRD